MQRCENVPRVRQRLRRAAAHVVATVGTVLLAACFHPTYNHPTCGPKEECPPGLTCSALQICENAQGETADAGACGDGIQQSNEECDGKDLGGKTCITEGFYGGTILCTADCKINLGGCSGRCGDGIRNSATEQCDGTNFGGTTENTCEVRGFHGAVQPLLCTSTCSLDPSSCSCGGEMCASNTQQCVLTDNIYSCVPYP